MTSLGFDNITESTGSNGGYLRTPGIQMNATFVGLEYVFSEAWEGFDIKMLTSDGKVFNERTFGANIDKVYPKNKWADGKQVGMETKQEAFDRVNQEISTKIYHLASCFVDRDTLKSTVRNVKDLKDLIDKTNKAMAQGDTDKKVNFLTMWKNSPTKQKSNLILADRIKWVEPTRFSEAGTPLVATISLSKYQLENNMIEKYPYQGAGAPQTAETILGGAADDLPF